MLMLWCLRQLGWVGWVLVTAALVGYWSLVGIGTVSAQADAEAVLVSR